MAPCFCPLPLFVPPPFCLFPPVHLLPPAPTAVLVHCGAGVSRSATLVMMYLMRSKHWSAQAAKDWVTAARSVACPNDGFWRVLCALEGPLGIADRWGGGGWEEGWG
jgi:hypothetical protein